MGQILKLKATIRFLFSIFVFSFAAIVAISLARGNTLTGTGIQQTGTIRLNANPSTGLEVFLNDQKQQLSNNVVNSVAPGRYEVSVRHEGYNEWIQTVEVEAGIVSDLSVQLFPEEFETTILSSRNVGKTFFSRDNRYAYYFVTDTPIGNDIGLWQQNLDQSGIVIIQEQPVKLSNLTPEFQAALTDEEPIEILANNANSRLLLKLSGDYYVINTGNYNEPSATNKVALNFPINNINWLGDDNLLIQSGELVFDYRISTKQSQLVTYVSGQNPVYAVGNNTVLLVEQSELFSYRDSTRTKVALSNVVLPISVKTIQTIANADKLLLTTAEGIYYLDIEQSYLTFIGNYEVVTWSPDGTRVWLKQGSAYSVFQVQFQEARNAVLTEMNSVSLPSTDLLVPRWAPGNSFVVFSDAGGELYLADSLGQNFRAIELPSQLASGSFAPQNTSVIVHLKDSNVEGETNHRNNIYRMEL